MDVYDFDVATIDGDVIRLDAYRGKTLLIVNVASKCGFTPQYAGLEELSRTFRNRGVVVLGFPCNQFGRQEPGNEREIQQFCRAKYDITFPLFGKIDVKGPRAHPLYRFLTAAKPGFLGTKVIKWNFTKFLVAPDGTVVRRYGPRTSPERIGADLEAQLG